MDLTRLVLAVIGVALLSSGQSQSTGVWLDIASCIQGQANSSTTNNSDFTLLDSQNVSMMDVFSLICQDKDGFVRCLDDSFKQSNDSMAQIIGSLFDSKTVIQAYTGLCSNITAIENGGAKVMKCLSKNTLLSCQSEMADYFFYMGVVRKFASPDDQLSRKTTETLLCSVTAQRRNCEVHALKECNQQLGDVMEEFYRQTRPQVCMENDQENIDNENVV